MPILSSPVLQKVFSGFSLGIVLSSLVSLTALIAMPRTAQALDYQTEPQLALRLQKAHQNNYFSDYSLTTRFTDGFDKAERYVLDAGFGRNIGQHQLSAAYVLHLRQLNPGNEHRLYQQYQYRIPLQASTLSLRGRIEQRYFDHNYNLAHRVRFQIGWSKSLNENWGLNLSNEVIHNLNNEGNISRGFNANVFTIGLRRELADGNQVGLNWNFRYIDERSAENILRQQVQLFYLFRWR